MVQFKTPPQQHFCAPSCCCARLWVSLNFKNDGHFSRLMKRCNEHKSGDPAALFQKGDERESERVFLQFHLYICTRGQIHLQFAWEKWPHKLQSGYKLVESIVAVSKWKAGEQHAMPQRTFIYYTQGAFFAVLNFTRRSSTENDLCSVIDRVLKSSCSINQLTYKNG